MFGTRYIYCFIVLVILLILWVGVKSNNLSYICDRSISPSTNDVVEGFLVCAAMEELTEGACDVAPLEELSDADIAAWGDAGLGDPVTLPGRDTRELVSDTYLDSDKFISQEEVTRTYGNPAAHICNNDVRKNISAAKGGGCISKGTHTCPPPSMAAAWGEASTSTLSPSESHRVYHRTDFLQNVYLPSLLQWKNDRARASGEAELLPAEWPPEEYVDGLMTPTPVGEYGVIPPIDYYALQLGYEIIDDDATLPEGVIDHDRRQKLCPSSHGCKYIPPEEGEPPETPSNCVTMSPPKHGEFTMCATQIRINQFGDYSASSLEERNNNELRLLARELGIDQATLQLAQIDSDGGKSNMIDLIKESVGDGQGNCESWQFICPSGTDHEGECREEEDHCTDPTSTPPDNKVYRWPGCGNIISGKSTDPTDDASSWIDRKWTHGNNTRYIPELHDNNLCRWSTDLQMCLPAGQRTECAMAPYQGRDFIPKYWGGHNPNPSPMPTNREADGSLLLTGGYNYKDFINNFMELTPGDPFPASAAFLQNDPSEAGKHTMPVDPEEECANVTEGSQGICQWDDGMNPPWSPAAPGSSEGNDVLLTSDKKGDCLRTVIMAEQMTQRCGWEKCGPSPAQLFERGGDLVGAGTEVEAELRLPQCSMPANHRMDCTPATTRPDWDPNTQAVSSMCDPQIQIATIPPETGNESPQEMMDRIDFIKDAKKIWMCPANFSPEGNQRAGCYSPSCVLDPPNQTPSPRTFGVDPTTPLTIPSTVFYNNGAEAPASCRLTSSGMGDLKLYDRHVQGPALQRCSSYGVNQNVLFKDTSAACPSCRPEIQAEQFPREISPLKASEMWEYKVSVECDFDQNRIVTPTAAGMHWVNIDAPDSHFRSCEQELLQLAAANFSSCVNATTGEILGRYSTEAECQEAAATGGPLGSAVDWTYTAAPPIQARQVGDQNEYGKRLLGGPSGGWVQAEIVGLNHDDTYDIKVGSETTTTSKVHFTRLRSLDYTTPSEASSGAMGPDQDPTQLEFWADLDPNNMGTSIADAHLVWDGHDLSVPRGRQPTYTRFHINDPSVHEIHTRFGWAREIWLDRPKESLGAGAGGRWRTPREAGMTISDWVSGYYYAYLEWWDRKAAAEDFSPTTFRAYPFGNPTTQLGAGRAAPTPADLPRHDAVIPIQLPWEAKPDLYNYPVWEKTTHPAPLTAQQEKGAKDWRDHILSLNPAMGLDPLELIHHITGDDRSHTSAWVDTGSAGTTPTCMDNTVKARDGRAPLGAGCGCVSSSKDSNHHTKFSGGISCDKDEAPMGDCCTSHSHCPAGTYCDNRGGCHSCVYVQNKGKNILLYEYLKENWWAQGGTDDEWLAFNELGGGLNFTKENILRLTREAMIASNLRTAPSDPQATDLTVDQALIITQANDHASAGSCTPTSDICDAIDQDCSICCPTSDGEETNYFKYKDNTVCEQYNMDEGLCNGVMGSYLTTYKELPPIPPTGQTEREWVYLDGGGIEQPTTGVPYTTSQMNELYANGTLTVNSQVKEASSSDGYVDLASLPVLIHGEIGVVMKEREQFLRDVSSFSGDRRGLFGGNITGDPVQWCTYDEGLTFGFSTPPDFLPNEKIYVHSRRTDPDQGVPSGCTELIGSYTVDPLFVPASNQMKVYPAPNLPDGATNIVAEDCFIEKENIITPLDISLLGLKTDKARPTIYHTCTNPDGGEPIPCPSWCAQSFGTISGPGELAITTSSIALGEAPREAVDDELLRHFRAENALKRFDNSARCDSGSPRCRPRPDDDTAYGEYDKVWSLWADGIGDSGCMNSSCFIQEGFTDLIEGFDHDNVEIIDASGNALSGLGLGFSPSTQAGDAGVGSITGGLSFTQAGGAGVGSITGGLSFTIGEAVHDDPNEVFRENLRLAAENGDLDVDGRRDEVLRLMSLEPHNAKLNLQHLISDLELERDSAQTYDQRIQLNGALDVLRSVTDIEFMIPVYMEMIQSLEGVKLLEISSLFHSAISASVRQMRDELDSLPLPTPSTGDATIDNIISMTEWYAENHGGWNSGLIGRMHFEAKVRGEILISLRPFLGETPLVDTAWTAADALVRLNAAAQPLLDRLSDHEEIMEPRCGTGASRRGGSPKPCEDWEDGNYSSFLDQEDRWRYWINFLERRAASLSAPATYTGLRSTATYTDADIAIIPEGSAARSTFVADFIEAVETAMSDVQAKADIEYIEGGSIRVGFAVNCADCTKEAATESFDALANGMPLALVIAGTAQAAPVVGDPTPNTFLNDFKHFEPGEMGLYYTQDRCEHSRGPHTRALLGGGGGEPGSRAEELWANEPVIPCGDCEWVNGTGGLLTSELIGTRGACEDDPRGDLAPPCVDDGSGYPSSDRGPGNRIDGLFIEDIIDIIKDHTYGQHTSEGISTANNPDSIHDPRCCIGCQGTAPAAGSESALELVAGGELVGGYESPTDDLREIGRAAPHYDLTMATLGPNPEQHGRVFQWDKTEVDMYMRLTPDDFILSPFEGDIDFTARSPYPSQGTALSTAPRENRMRWSDVMPPIGESDEYDQAVNDLRRSELANNSLYAIPQFWHPGSPHGWQRMCIPYYQIELRDKVANRICQSIGWERGKSIDTYEGQYELKSKDPEHNPEELSGITRLWERSKNHPSNKSQGTLSVAEVDERNKDNKITTSMSRIGLPGDSQEIDIWWADILDRAYAGGEDAINELFKEGTYTGAAYDDRLHGQSTPGWGCGEDPNCEPEPVEREYMERILERDGPKWDISIDRGLGIVGAPAPNTAASPSTLAEKENRNKNALMTYQPRFDGRRYKDHSMRNPERPWRRHGYYRISEGKPVGHTMLDGKTAWDREVEGSVGKIGDQADLANVIDSSNCFRQESRRPSISLGGRGNYSVVATSQIVAAAEQVGVDLPDLPQLERHERPDKWSILSTEEDAACPTPGIWLGHPTPTLLPATCVEIATEPTVPADRDACKRQTGREQCEAVMTTADSTVNACRYVEASRDPEVEKYWFTMGEHGVGRNDDNPLWRSKTWTDGCGGWEKLGLGYDHNNWNRGSEERPHRDLVEAFSAAEGHMDGIRYETTIPTGQGSIETGGGFVRPNSSIFGLDCVHEHQGTKVNTSLFDSGYIKPNIEEDDEGDDEKWHRLIKQPEYIDRIDRFHFDRTTVVTDNPDHHSLDCGEDDNCPDSEGDRTELTLSEFQERGPGTWGGVRSGADLFNRYRHMDGDHADARWAESGWDATKGGGGLPQITSGLLSHKSMKERINPDNQDPDNKIWALSLGQLPSTCILDTTGRGWEPDDWSLMHDDHGVVGGRPGWMSARLRDQALGVITGQEDWPEDADHRDDILDDFDPDDPDAFVPHVSDLIQKPRGMGGGWGEPGWRGWGSEGGSDRDISQDGVFYRGGDSTDPQTIKGPMGKTTITASERRGIDTSKNILRIKCSGNRITEELYDKDKNLYDKCVNKWNDDVDRRTPETDTWYSDNSQIDTELSSDKEPLGKPGTGPFNKSYDGIPGEGHVRWGESEFVQGGPRGRDGWNTKPHRPRGELTRRPTTRSAVLADAAARRQAMLDDHPSGSCEGTGYSRIAGEAAEAYNLVILEDMSTCMAEGGIWRLDDGTVLENWAAWESRALAQYYEPQLYDWLIELDDVVEEPTDQYLNRNWNTSGGGRVALNMREGFSNGDELIIDVNNVDSLSDWQDGESMFINLSKLGGPEEQEVNFSGQRPQGDFKVTISKVDAEGGEAEWTVEATPGHKKDWWKLEKNYSGPQVFIHKSPHIWDDYPDGGHVGDLDGDGVLNKWELPVSPAKENWGRYDIFSENLDNTLTDSVIPPEDLRPGGWETVKLMGDGGIISPTLAQEGPDGLDLQEEDDVCHKWLRADANNMGIPKVTDYIDLCKKEYNDPSDPLRAKCVKNAEMYSSERLLKILNDKRTWRNKGSDPELYEYKTHPKEGSEYTKNSWRPSDGGSCRDDPFNELSDWMNGDRTLPRHSASRPAATTPARQSTASVLSQAIPGEPLEIITPTIGSHIMWNNDDWRNLEWTGVPDQAYDMMYNSVGDYSASALREELQDVRIMELHARATAEGVGEALLEEAMDSAEPRAALIELLVERQAAARVVTEEMNSVNKHGFMFTDEDQIENAIYNRAFFNREKMEVTTISDLVEDRYQHVEEAKKILGFGTDPSYNSPCQNLVEERMTHIAYTPDISWPNLSTPPWSSFTWPQPVKAIRDIVDGDIASGNNIVVSPGAVTPTTGAELSLARSKRAGRPVAAFGSPSPAPSNYLQYIVSNKGEEGREIGLTSSELNLARNRGEHVEYLLNKKYSDMEINAGPPKLELMDSSLWGAKLNDLYDIPHKDQATIATPSNGLDNMGDPYNNPKHLIWWACHENAYPNYKGRNMITDEIHSSEVDIIEDRNDTLEMYSLNPLIKDICPLTCGWPSETPHPDEQICYERMDQGRKHKIDSHTKEKIKKRTLGHGRDPALGLPSCTTVSYEDLKQGKYDILCDPFPQEIEWGMGDDESGQRMSLVRSTIAADPPSIELNYIKYWPPTTPSDPYTTSTLSADAVQDRMRNVHKYRLIHGVKCSNINDMGCRPFGDQTADEHTRTKWSTIIEYPRSLVYTHEVATPSDETQLFEGREGRDSIGIRLYDIRVPGTTTSREAVIDDFNKYPSCTNEEIEYMIDLKYDAVDSSIALPSPATHSWECIMRDDEDLDGGKGPLTLSNTDPRSAEYFKGKDISKFIFENPHYTAIDPKNHPLLHNSEQENIIEGFDGIAPAFPVNLEDIEDILDYRTEDLIAPIDPNKGLPHMSEHTKRNINEQYFLLPEHIQNIDGVATVPFYGDNELSEPSDTRIYSPWSGSGTCRPSQTRKGKICNCKAGYTGPYCEIKTKCEGKDCGLWSYRTEKRRIEDEQNPWTPPSDGGDIVKEWEPGRCTNDLYPGDVDCPGNLDSGINNKDKLLDENEVGRLWGWNSWELGGDYGATIVRDYSNVEGLRRDPKSINTEPQESNQYIYNNNPLPFNSETDKNIQNVWSKERAIPNEGKRVSKPGCQRCGLFGLPQFQQYDNYKDKPLLEKPVHIIHRPPDAPFSPHLNRDTKAIARSWGTHNITHPADCIKYYAENCHNKMGIECNNCIDEVQGIKAGECTKEEGFKYCSDKEQPGYKYPGEPTTPSEWRQLYNNPLVPIQDIENSLLRHKKPWGEMALKQDWNNISIIPHEDSLKWDWKDECPGPKDKSICPRGYCGGVNWWRLPSEVEIDDMLNTSSLRDIRTAIINMNEDLSSPTLGPPDSNGHSDLMYILDLEDGQLTTGEGGVERTPSHLGPSCYEGPIIEGFSDNKYCIGLDSNECFQSIDANNNETISGVELRSWIKDQETPEYYRDKCYTTRPLNSETGENTFNQDDIDEKHRIERACTREWIGSHKNINDRLYGQPSSRNPTGIAVEECDPSNDSKLGCQNPPLEPSEPSFSSTERIDLNQFQEWWNDYILNPPDYIKDSIGDGSGKCISHRGESINPGTHIYTRDVMTPFNCLSIGSMGGWAPGLDDYLVNNKEREGKDMPHPLRAFNMEHDVGDYPNVKGPIQTFPDLGSDGSLCLYPDNTNYITECENTESNSYNEKSKLLDRRINADIKDFPDNWSWSKKLKERGQSDYNIKAPEINSVTDTYDIPSLATKRLCRCVSSSGYMPESSCSIPSTEADDLGQKCKEQINDPKRDTYMDMISHRIEPRCNIIGPSTTNAYLVSGADNARINGIYYAEKGSDEEVIMNNGGFYEDGDCCKVYRKGPFKLRRYLKEIRSGSDMIGSTTVVEVPEGVTGHNINPEDYIFPSGAERLNPEHYTSFIHELNKRMIYNLPLNSIRTDHVEAWWEITEDGKERLECPSEGGLRCVGTGDDIRARACSGECNDAIQRTDTPPESGWIEYPDKHYWSMENVESILYNNHDILPDNEMVISNGLHVLKGLPPSSFSNLSVTPYIEC